LVFWSLASIYIKIFEISIFLMYFCNARESFWSDIIIWRHFLMLIVIVMILDRYNLSFLF